MTLNDIQLATYRRTGYSDTPAAEVVTRILQWINIWHVRLLTRPGIGLLNDSTQNVVVLTTVPLQVSYVLPVYVRRIIKITEQTTPLTLRMESLTWIREHDPGNAVVGIPEVWAPLTWGLVTPPPTPPLPLIAQLTIRLWPTPAGTITYGVDTHMPIPDLVGPTDQPYLPLEYHWLLVQAACYEEWMRKADTRSGTARQDLETGFKEMRHWLSNPPDYQPTNMPQTTRQSRLGGWYPHW
jgi:hypothetical protein